MSVKVWSNFQNAVFDFVKHGAGNGIVKAVAGSGKTTTLVEAINNIPDGASCIFLAFNKSIATELQSRNVPAKTFHGMCYSPVARFLNVKTADTNKTRKIAERLMSVEDYKIHASNIQRLVGLAKASGIGCLIDDIESAWFNIIDHHEIDTDYPSELVQHSRKVFNACNSDKSMDFDDMLFFPVYHKISLPKYDYIFVDEAQDTNDIQRAIVRKLMKPNSRVIFVGDESQAIYGFRGADSDSMANISRDFNCTELPLSVSYRCAESIVKYAQQWNPDIVARDNAPMGEVLELGHSWDHKVFNQGDLIVCRNTAPLVQLCYQFIAKRIPANIMGKDIGKGLVNLVNKMKAKGINALIEKLEDYRQRETDAAMAKNQQYKAGVINDKVDCIMLVISTLDENNRTVPELVRTMEMLFTDDTNGSKRITLATIHKSKGMESNTVYWLNPSLCPSKYATQEWQMKQEHNLCYVATTRALSRLITIEQAKEKETAPV